MSIESGDTSPHESKEDAPEVLLYRGIDTASKGRLGHWWSTNPYYSLRYSNGGRGEMYVARLGPSEIAKRATDVSIEAEYQNYLFKEDPPAARQVTPEEIAELKSQTTFIQGAIGGMMMHTPENAVEIGKAIFGRK